MAWSRSELSAAGFFYDEDLRTDLKCYPWLIVECKSGKGTLKESQRLAQLETVCCQALNASACAVKLNQIAARYAVELRKQTHIPPIPAVTTVGPKVSVWITYYAKDFMAYNNACSYRRQDQGYMMQLVWEGDMTETRDIREFQLILENTYTWDMRVFKLQINGLIDHWRAAHCSVESTPLRRSTRLREKAASQPGTPFDSSRNTRSSNANIGQGTTAVLIKTPGSPESPQTPKTPTARAGRASAPARAAEVSSGSESSSDSDAEEADDNPAYSPSSSSSTFYTASEGRSVRDSMGPPSARSSARSSARLSTRSSVGPPPSIRSSMGPPSWRSLRGPASSASSRGQASVCSSVDPLLDSANIDDWGYTPQQNPSVASKLFLDIHSHIGLPNLSFWMHDLARYLSPKVTADLRVLVILD
ncbi:hypothetical protein FAGAP_3084 [Fusarium agapanthi]|uniref:Uncharacterized protein n=1 Tax=Fusarium agapanthi TaxID=1803897 RepID=A0A9P5E9E1_9HYPO|nr:hypothetical protein FAGAP_3084 [Fusarium agapanthi]